MIRLFAAVAIPEVIAEGLACRQLDLPGAGWRPPVSLHVTLRFFGPVTETMADDLDSALSVVGGAAFALTLAGVGVFQDGPRLRAVWAAVEETAALSRLAGRCESAARQVGLRSETRPFRPHVTLAYLKGADPGRVAAWLQEHNLLRSPPFHVDAFGLYSSWRSAEGSVYRLERRYSLN